MSNIVRLDKVNWEKHEIHSLIFKYENGDESKMIDEILLLVERGEISWFEASLLCNKIGQNLYLSLSPFILPSN